MKWETPWGMTVAELSEKWQHVIEAGSHAYTWTSPEELAYLAEMASRSTWICEIGSYHGRSALTMALANPKCYLACLDNCENPGVREMFAHNLAQQMQDDQVCFYEGTSDLLRRQTARIFDGAFIDAAHLEQDVMNDIANVLPRMKPGALLVGHDYRQDNPTDGVNKAVHAAFGEPQWVFQSLWAVRLP